MEVIAKKEVISKKQARNVCVIQHLILMAVGIQHESKEMKFLRLQTSFQLEFKKNKNNLELL